jgi:PIN domain nuclease of toxin-antitoxin system
MRVLLDTHAFLWWITEDRRLSARALEVMTDGGNNLLLSAVSGWEIAIKASLGRITLPIPIDGFLSEQLRRNGIGTLPIEMHHALGVHALPLLHRDPFDRLLVTQAQLEKLRILTSDPQIAQYDVETLW